MKKYFFYLGLLSLGFGFQGHELQAQRGFRGGFGGRPHFYQHDVFIHNTFYERPRIDVFQPRVFRTFDNLPLGYRTFGWEGRNFYFHGGFYYDYFENKYRIIAPPFGFTLDVLPDNYFSFEWGGVPHFYYHGVFYRRENNVYVVEEPIVGAVVYEIPEQDAEIVTINNNNYYEINGYLYQKGKTNSKTSYTVVGKYQNNKNKQPIDSPSTYPNN
ncbi:MAG: DUF6515 family protein [Alphaproteobacteria bacterium]|nr:DUF6515 family protein [Alphaproteobacteria bacterium]